MRVFVTGGTGYVGGHIIRELLMRGDQITVLARDPAKVAGLHRPGVTLLRGDVQDIDLIRASLPGHDTCIHNAIVWDEEPTELELKDTRASVAIFEAAANAAIEHLIYTSSTAVHRPFKTNMNEEDRLQTNDFYGATKACGEMFLSAMSHQHPMRCNIVRPGPVIGPPAFLAGNVNTNPRFYEIIKAARAGEDIVVARDDGRQFIAVGDLAKLFVSVLHSDANRETYLGVAEEFTTWEQIAEQVIAELRSKSKVIVESSNATPPTFDVGKIKRDFGLAFRTSEAMKAHISYLCTQS
jgi:nucleoside-diphosphate-sugar epimerase